MNSLRESMAFAKQALRAVDGNENGAQGKFHPPNQSPQDEN